MNSRTVSQVMLGVVSLAISGAVIAGFIWGLPTFLIGLAAGALSLVIVLMWASLQQMEEEGDMEFEQALSYAAPSAEEEQKRALLRTLKDLEYELSVGKISREDYDQVSAEVREKAKRMIALTDEAMKEKLQAAEERVSAHLREEEDVEAPRKKKPSKKKPKVKAKSRDTSDDDSKNSSSAQHSEDEGSEESPSESADDESRSHRDTDSDESPGSDASSDADQEEKLAPADGEEPSKEEEVRS